MKIAIPTAEKKLCMHFGHCQEFALVDIDPDTKKISSEEFCVPPAHEPGVLPAWLGEKNVNVIIAGGMGQHAQQLFKQQNIEVVIGAPSLAPAELAVAFVSGTLTSGVNSCDH